MYDDSTAKPEMPEGLATVMDTANKIGIPPTALRHFIDTGIAPAPALQHSGTMWLDVRAFTYWWEGVQRLFEIVPDYIAAMTTTVMGSSDHDTLLEIPECLNREPGGKAGLVEAAAREAQRADTNSVHKGRPAALAVVTTFPPQAHPVPVMRGNVMFCPNFMGAAVVVEDTEDDNKLVCGFCRAPAHQPDHRPLLRIISIELDEHSKGRD